MKTKISIAVSCLVLSVVCATTGQASYRELAVSKMVQNQLNSCVVVGSRTFAGITTTQGAGVIVDEHGAILTNAHVVAEALTKHLQIEVGFHDHQWLDAQVICDDPSADLALLKVLQLHDFPAVKVGPADVKISEGLVVIGNPVGLTFTVTRGTVTRVPTDMIIGPGATVARTMIQTDAAINPGNSGGPAFNLDGEMIGLATLRAANAQSTGWLISADMIEHFLATRSSAATIAGIDHGLVLETVLDEELQGPERRWIKVDYVTSQLAVGFKRDDRIISVATGAAGRQRIHTIGSRFDFERSLWSCKPGEAVTVTVARRNAEGQLQQGIIKLPLAPHMPLRDPDEDKSRWVVAP